MPDRDQLFNGFTIGDWEVLPGKGLLRRNGEEVHPEPKVFEVLLALARRDGNLITRDELVDEVWDGRATSDEPINRCLSQLRGHLDDRKRPHQYVETLQRRGYRLMKPVLLREPAVAGATAAGKTRRSRNGMVVGLLSAVVAFAAAGWLFHEFANDEKPGSLAVLPIDNLSGDPGNQYIVDGIKNVLVSRLSEIAGLSVKNARVRYELEPSEIADILNVDMVLTGAAQLQGDTLKVTYLLTRAADNVMVGSGEVNGNLDGVFSLQQRLAAAVKAELVGEDARELITRYTPDSVAYDSYLRGVYALEHRGDADNLEKAIALFQESIERDEYYGPAYLSLATAYALLPRYRGAPVEETARLAIEVVRMGVAVDENIADAANAVFGSAYHQQKRWSESEAAYRRAVSAPVVDSIAFNWYSRMLSSVGRFDEALQQALSAVAIDPDNALNNSRLGTVYTYLGDTRKAHEYFERAEALGASGPTYLQPYALLLARDGDFALAREKIRDSMVRTGRDSSWVDVIFAAFTDPLLRQDALQALDTASADDAVEPQVEFVARTWLGDTDGAMTMAQRLVDLGEYFEIDLLFVPGLEPLREHPGFPLLLDNLGITAYWEQNNCRWNGRKASCGN
jgi:DNA-binding winged helix-turn-helix (wHTH) protein/TolB-like protein